MRLKICGITCQEDAARAEALGADYLGFVFAKASPRCISTAHAAEIISTLQHVNTVGVFVEHTDEEISQIMHTCHLDFAQVYREITLTGIKVIRGISVSTAEPLTPKFLSPADFLLYDTYDPHKKGGTGKSFAWQVLPKDLSRAFVAGGINETNVRTLIEHYHPYGIDLSSSVEAYPGKKDPKKLERFFKACRR